MDFGCAVIICTPEEVARVKCLYSVNADAVYRVFSTKTFTNLCLKGVFKQTCKK